jgi:hypothetical protein
MILIPLNALNSIAVPLELIWPEEPAAVATDPPLPCANPHTPRKKTKRAESMNTFINFQPRDKRIAENEGIRLQN